MIKNSLEYRLKDDEILYFQHIPKTAGTSLITILDSHFDPESILHERSWKYLIRNMPKDFSKIRLIRGHFFYGIHRLFPKKVIYFTMLRDPVELTVSFYDMIRRQPDLAKRLSISAEKSISELITDPKKTGLVNPQTRNLAIDLDVISISKSLKKVDLQNFYPEETDQFKYPHLSDDELLERAKQHLSQFKFLGLTERFQDSLLLLNYTFGWPPIRDTLQLNISPKKSALDSLTKEAREKILERTKLDSNLYNFAQKLFESRFSQMIRELKEKFYEKRFEHLPQGEMLYELLEKNYDKKFAETETLKDSLDFNFGQSIHGSNWYGGEISNLGTKFRWMGPNNESTCDFPLSKNNDFLIQFKVIHYPSKDMLNSVKLKINNDFINLKKINEKNNQPIFEGKISKSILQTKNNFTRLTFQINQVVSNKTINPNAQHERMLGLAFEWIKFRPLK